MSFQSHNDRATVLLKGVSSEVDEELLVELAVQFGPPVRVQIPRDRTGETAYIEFQSAADAQYMSEVIQASAAPLKLYGRTIGVTWRGGKSKGGSHADALLDIGATIEVTGLNRRSFDLDQLRSHFRQFGRLATPPQIQREGQSTGGGADACSAVVSFAQFEGADAAIKATNDQFLFGSKVKVQYALKGDGSGNRHGSEEERALYAAGGDAAGAVELYRQRREQEVRQAEAQRQAAQAAADGPEWARGVNPFKQI